MPIIAAGAGGTTRVLAPFLRGRESVSHLRRRVRGVARNLFGEDALRAEVEESGGALLMPRVSADEIRDPLGRLREAIERIRYRRKVRFWKANGVRFGRGVVVMPSAWLDVSYGWMISIGDYTRICENVRILVHDASAQFALQYGRVGLVTIGRYCMISERSVILPGVTIGDNCLIGAGSVVAHDIPPNSRAIGVPARVYGTVEGYFDETRRAIECSPRFRYCELHDLDEEQREAVRELLAAAGGRGFHRDPFSASPYFVNPP